MDINQEINNQEVSNQEVKEQEINNQEVNDQEEVDNHIVVTDEDGKKYRAEVYDIFQVEGYGENNYIMYSFGEAIDDDNERVYISKIVESGEDFDLVEISDQTEWDAVNKAIAENLESLGDA